MDKKLTINQVVAVFGIVAGLLLAGVCLALKVDSATPGRDPRDPEAEHQAVTPPVPKLFPNAESMVTAIDAHHPQQDSQQNAQQPHESPEEISRARMQKAARRFEIVEKLITSEEFSKLSYHDRVACLFREAPQLREIIEELRRKGDGDITILAYINTCLEILHFADQINKKGDGERFKRLPASEAVAYTLERKPELKNFVTNLRRQGHDDADILEDMSDCMTSALCWRYYNIWADK